MEFSKWHCIRKEDYWNCGLDGFGAFPADEEMNAKEFEQLVEVVKEKSDFKKLGIRMIIATTITAYQKKAAKALKLAGFKKVASCPGMHGSISGTCQLWVKTNLSKREY